MKITEENYLSLIIEKLEKLAELEREEKTADEHYKTIDLINYLNKTN